MFPQKTIPTTLIPSIFLIPLIPLSTSATAVPFAPIEPQALAKLPRLADGDAVIKPVAVSAGDRVVDAAGAVVTLVEGVTVRTAAGACHIGAQGAVARPEAQNFGVDPTQPSELWNLFEIGLLP